MLLGLEIYVGEAWLVFKPDTESHLYAKMGLVDKYALCRFVAYHSRASNQG